jgi:hypothetical protein
MSIFGTGLTAYNLGQAAGLWGGTPSPGTQSPGAQTQAPPQPAPRRPFGGPTGTSGPGAPQSAGAFLGNLWNRASGMAQRAYNAAVPQAASPAAARPQPKPAVPQGPRGMPPGMALISDRSGNARQHAGALAQRDKMMGDYSAQIDKQNQSIAETMRGNAERVGQNKERMARVMAAQAGQAGQIAQAQAMAQAAQANAQAQMASERMRNDRIAQILRHIGNDGYSF